MLDPARINCLSAVAMRKYRTFFASFLAFFCLAADAFSILWRRRTGTRFDFGSGISVSIAQFSPSSAYLTSDLHCGLLSLCLDVEVEISTSSKKVRQVKILPPSAAQLARLHYSPTADILPGSHMIADWQNSSQTHVVI